MIVNSVPASCQQRPWIAGSQRGAALLCWLLFSHQGLCEQLIQCEEAGEDLLVGKVGGEGVGGGDGGV